MESDSEQLQFKKLIVEFMEEQSILKAEVNHLREEINKRVSDIQVLLAQRELALSRLDMTASKYSLDQHQQQQQHPHSSKPHQNIGSARTEDSEPSSEFAKQVEFLLSDLAKTTEEVYTLVKL